MAEGRTVTIAVKVSEAEAAVIDMARGTETRSAWLRTAALAAARPGRRKRPATARPARSGATPCPHPKTRVIKGLCHACGTSVGT